MYLFILPLDYIGALVYYFCIHSNNYYYWDKMITGTKNSKSTAYWNSKYWNTKESMCWCSNVGTGIASSL